MMRVRPYRTSENRIEGLVVVLTDVDQLRRAQDHLRDARDFAQAVVESVQVPIVVLDSDLRIRTANNAARTMLRIAQDDPERRSLVELLALDWGAESVRSLAAKLEAKSAENSFELEHEASAEARVFRVKGVTLQREGEKLLLLTMEDVTMHKAAEEFLAQQNRSLSGQMLTTAQALHRAQEELRELAASLFTTQEEERRRVARELHDDISQQLAGLVISIEQAKQGLPQDQQSLFSALETMRARAAAIAEGVRSMSHRLHPAILEDLGLAPAMEALVEELGTRHQMLVAFSELNGPVQAPSEVAGVLYRIAQEALRNVVKHAGKTHVKVSLARIRAGVRLEVADFGTGFEPQTRGRGLGFTSMTERARLVRGTVSIQSTPGKGTTVVVEVPLEPERNESPN
jgi:two-component system CheB/CheR fusion protein